MQIEVSQRILRNRIPIAGGKAEQVQGFLFIFFDPAPMQVKHGQVILRPLLALPCSFFIPKSGVHIALDKIVTSQIVGEPEAILGIGISLIGCNSPELQGFFRIFCYTVTLFIEVTMNENIFISFLIYWSRCRLCVEIIKRII